MEKIVTVIGARPQFIKMALVSTALKAKEIEEVVLHTGQHYDSNLSESFFKELGIKKPKYDLGIGSGPRKTQIKKMAAGIEKALKFERPEMVLVYGDTNSTLAGALAASSLGIPLAHIEAGLRSFNLNMAEEANRVITDRLSSILFCPTGTAVENLKSEGITKGVYLVGDVMYDSIKKKMKMTVLARNRLHYVLCTIHRAENTDNRRNLYEIFKGLSLLEDRVVLPLHPRTAKYLKKYGIEASANIRITKPVGYMDMLDLERRADAIVTDSGGVQKEAFIFGVGCITIRDETEWTETVQRGMNMIAGANAKNIARGVKRMKRLKKRVDPEKHYGNGSAHKKIAVIIKKYLKGPR